MINKVILMGRLTKDPELKKTPTNNTSLCQFNLAVERSYGYGGEKQVDFINCIAWKTYAENLVKYMRKGSLIVVEGAIEVSSYEDANGTKRTKVQVNVSNIIYVPTGKQKEENEEAQTYQRRPKVQTKQPTPDDFMS